MKFFICGFLTILLSGCMSGNKNKFVGKWQIVHFAGMPMNEKNILTMERNGDDFFFRADKAGTEPMRLKYDSECDCLQGMDGNINMTVQYVKETSHIIMMPKKELVENLSRHLKNNLGRMEYMEFKKAE